MSIEAMKMALEALETHVPHVYKDRGYEPITALRQAIEQAEKPSTGNVLMDAYNAMVAKQRRAEKQEPYGYLWFTHHIERRFTHYKPKEEQRIGDVKPVYAAPVDAINISQEHVDETAKRKHEWVGLTDEEINALARWADEHAAPFHLEFAKAIEAKLKEKNT